MTSRTVRSGANEFSEDLVRWRQFTNAGCYRRIAELLELLLAEDAEVSLGLETAWCDRQFVAFYDRPLLLMASLRWAALREGPGHPLWKAVGTGDLEAPVDQGQLVEALSGTRIDFWNAIATRTVQTNESTRAVVWLWPACFLGLEHSCD